MLDSRFVFEQTTDSGKDLEAAAAMIEEKEVENMVTKLVAEYRFSSDRAFEVARLTTSFRNLSSKRDLSNREKDMFVRELIGVSYSQGKEALEASFEGNTGDLEAVLENAATLNGTNPKAIKPAMEKLFSGKWKKGNIPENLKGIKKM